MHKITITMHIWPFRLSYLLLIVLSQPGNDKAAEDILCLEWTSASLEFYILWGSIHANLYGGSYFYFSFICVAIKSEVSRIWGDLYPLVYLTPAEAEQCKI